jgi:hypothetical protein
MHACIPCYGPSVGVQTYLCTAASFYVYLSVCYLGIPSRPPPHTHTHTNPVCGAQELGWYTTTRVETADTQLVRCAQSKIEQHGDVILTYAASYAVQRALIEAANAGGWLGWWCEAPRRGRSARWAGWAPSHATGAALHR